jgi:hypothetical protein
MVGIAGLSLHVFETEFKEAIKDKRALLLPLFWVIFGFWFFLRLLTYVMAGPLLNAISNFCYSKVTEKINVNKDIISIGIVCINATFFLWYLFI